MENIKISSMPEYFKILGWQTNDLIGTAVGSADKTKFSRQIFSLGEFLSRLSENPISPQQCQNHYYSIAQYMSRTHSKQDNVQTVKELVLDIDYGTIGHQRAQFATQEEAMAYIKTLPTPTILVMSGGGYQLHYRLDGGAEKHQFMLNMQMLTQILQIDHCTSCEHLWEDFCQ